MKCNFKKSCSALVVISCFSLAGAEKIHEVQKGETLYSISRSYGVTVDSVKKLNGFSENDIKIGQKIKIPENDKTSSQNSFLSASSKTEKKSSAATPGEYVVQKGETWFGISKKYGISVADLQKMNGADSSSALKIGQKLKVPGNTAPETAVSGTAEKNSASAASKNAVAASAETANKNIPKIDDPHKYSDKKGDSSLVWPVKTSDVTYIKGKVGGVCLAAKKDEGVTSIRAGTVMFSGSYRGFGNVVFIQSKTGHIYAYTGLGSVEVSKGEYVNFGSQIGTAGVDSYTEKSQVNLMVFQNGQPIDPAKAPRG